jgi:hypothetical protein
VIHDKDQIYWFFSSAVQSIAAFIALLFTGYAVVLNIMDGLESKDETLVEIHKEFRKAYYRRLKGLAISAAFAMIGSLTVIYLNPYQNALTITFFFWRASLLF